MPAVSSDLRFENQLRLSSRIFCGIVLAMACVVLAGWVFDFQKLRRPMAEFSAMNPVTAVLFILTISSSRLLQETSGAAARWLATGYALLVLTVAGAHLGDIFLRLNLEVDRIFFPTRMQNELLNGAPNRMAPNTAFSFIFVAMALLLIHSGRARGKMPAQYALVPVFITAVLSLLGYLYGVPLFYVLPPYNPMAPHTATAFVLCGLAILWAEPRRGFMRTFTTSFAGSRQGRWLIFAIITIPVLFGYLLLAANRSIRFPMEFGFAVLVLSVIVVLVAMVWHQARALNIKHTEEIEARQQLSELNQQLEKRADEKASVALKTEMRLQHILDNMLEGVQIIDHQWRYLYVNEALAKQAGLARNKLIGFVITELYPGVEQTELFQTLNRCMLKRTTEHLESPFQHTDGRVGWYEMSIQPMPEGIFILTVDITERKSAEALIRKANEELETKVVERTHQLETLNHELESFSYSVSHDLRAPLRIIGGFARMLEETAEASLTTEQKEILQVIRNSIDRMDRLIDDLLKFSMLGTRPLQKATVQMNELVAEVISELRLPAEAKAHIAVEPLENAEGDAVLLRQVLTNLISNAIKYSEKKEHPEIKISCKAGEGETVFSVSDNGVGFDMAYADRLFGVFQRLHSSADYDGTGVGLAIVQRVIHRHGGRVWATAEKDKGATFNFTLPKAADR